LPLIIVRVKLRLTARRCMYVKQYYSGHGRYAVSYSLLLATNRPWPLADNGQAGGAWPRPGEGRLQTGGENGRTGPGVSAPPGELTADRRYALVPLTRFATNADAQLRRGPDVSPRDTLPPNICRRFWLFRLITAPLQCLWHDTITLVSTLLLTYLLIHREFFPSWIIAFPFPFVWCRLPPSTTPSADLQYKTICR